MKTPFSAIRFGWAIALAIVLSLAPDSVAQHVNVERGCHADRVVIRRTIPDPFAVK